MRVKYLVGVLVLVGIVTIIAMAGNAKGATINVPADYPTIQAAINAASNGDTIIVAAGTYTETIDIAKPLTIEGESLSGVIIDASAFSDYGIDVTSNDVTLKNFTLIGPPSATYGYGIKVSGCSNVILNNLLVRNSGRSGIDFNGCDGVLVSDVESRDNGGVGIAVTDSSNVELRNITTSGNAWGGIAIFTYGQYYPGGCDNIVLSGSNSFGEATPLYTQTGNYSGGPDYPITNLDVSNDFSYTVRAPVSDPHTTGYYATLADAINAAVGAVGMGAVDAVVNEIATGYYYVGSGMYIQAAINAASNEDTIIVHDGMYKENLVIDKSITLKAASTPVIDGQQAGPCITINANNVTIDGLEIFNGTYGIVGSSSGVDNCVIQNCIIHDNVDTTGTDGIGIMFWTDTDGVDFDNIQILNNEIYNNGRQGIFLGSMASLPAISDGCIISGNMIYNNGNDPTPIDQYGIQLSYADGNIVSNNEIYGHDDWGFANGIYLMASYNNTITGNTIHDNLFGISQWAWVRTFAGINTLIGNTFQNNTRQIADFDGMLDIQSILDNNTFDRAVVIDRPGASLLHSIWSNIQDAVDAASDGDTIIVKPGTYTESVTISKNIDLIGETGATIICPSSPEDVYIQESGHLYEYVIGVFGGTYSSGNDTYYGSGTVTVHISGFTIDSNNYVPSDRYAAIFFRNMVGSISGCTIINTNVNGHETFGILGYGDGINVDIYGNTVDQFARGGIGLIDGVFTIHDNTVIGPGLGVPVTWAPNGIQVGYGASGTISNNEVSGCGWPGTDWAGTGILVVDTHGVVVSNNYVHDCEQAIGVVDFPAAWHPVFADYLSNVMVSNNVIDGNEWGITINNDARNVTLIGNTITNTIYDAIDVWNYGYGDPSPTDVEIHYNNIYGNGWGIWTDSAQVDPVNATYNWWGDDSGPYNATLNPSGTGDGVEGNVIFDPWIITTVEDTHTEEVSGSTTVDATDEADTELIIETTSPTNVSIVSYTDNPASDDLPGGVQAVGNYIDVNVEDPSAIDWPIEIRIYYTQADLDALKITEDQIIGMYYWNGTAWVLYNDTGVNTANVGIYEGYVWGLAWNEDMLSPKAGGGLDNDTPISDSYVTYDPNGYITRVSTIHIYATDKGWWKIKYRINDGEIREGEWNKEVHFQLNQPGEYKIEYWAVDGWGHEEKPHHVETYIVDLEPPQVDISFDGIYELAPSAKYYISPSTTIIINAYDEGCGVDKIEYRVDDGETLPYTAPFTLPNGKHNLYIAAYDTLGNMQVKHYTIQVGGGEPTTKCLLNPSLPDGENGWYLNPVTVTLEATDEVSGVAKTFYRIDDGEWKEYTGAFEVGEGKHVISYYSIDNAGFVEKIRKTYINVDMYAPEINIKKPKGWLYIADRAILPLFGEKAIIVGKITIEAVVKDPFTSGVQTTTLYVDGNIKAEGENHIKYTLDEIMFGWHEIRIEAKDVAGNLATEEIKVMVWNPNIIRSSI